MTDNTITVNGKQVDAQTGELVNPANADLLALARQTADAFVDSERARLAYEGLEATIRERIALEYPQLASIREQVAQTRIAYEDAQARLRDTALACWREDKAGGKRLLGGAITIAESQRVTFYDEAAALDWCVEMHATHLIMKSVDKRGIEQYARKKQLPREVMTLETIAETRVNVSALAALASKEQSDG